MHRSYNSYNPVASKLLQKRWDDKHFSDHRRAVTGVRPEIDSTPPITFMHLHLKLKKLQLEEERLATIERDNRILLEKMSHTMRNKGQLDNINSAVPKSLSKGRRDRELLRITRENMNMLKRIAGKKPQISREEHERDWQENLHFMSNISSFPEDWYLKNMRKMHRSQPNLQAESNEFDEPEKKAEKPVERAKTTPKPVPKPAPAPIAKEEKIKPVTPVKVEAPKPATPKAPTPKAVTPKPATPKSTTPVQVRTPAKSLEAEDYIVDEIKDDDNKSKKSLRTENDDVVSNGNDEEF